MSAARLIPSQKAIIRVRRSIALFLLLFFMLACTPRQEIHSDTSLENATLVLIPVRTTTVQLISDENLLHFAGVARNRQRAFVTFQVDGVIDQRMVEIGEKVNQGDILARLSNPLLQPQLDTALSRLRQATSDRMQAHRDQLRVEQLFARGVATEQEVELQSNRLENLHAAVEDAEASVRQAEQLFEEASLRAPFAGTVNAILLEPGEFAQPGQAVMQLSSADSIEIEVRVPGAILGSYTPGDTVKLRDPLRNRTLTGTIRDIGRGSDTALYPLIISVSDPVTYPGDALEVALVRQSEPGLAIPLTSVMRTASGLAVFTVRQSVETGHYTAARVPVQIDRMQGEQLILASSLNGQYPLSPGDKIVYAGLSRLTDGDAVQVLP
jgi:RND family efflux transporter MFP subunit